MAVDNFDKLRGQHLFSPDDTVPAALAGGHLEALWLPGRKMTLCL